MISTPQSPRRCSNPMIQTLLLQMTQHNGIRESSIIKKINADRKMFHSYSAKTKRSALLQNRAEFNNKTKQGELIDVEFKSIPYVFVPGYKNDTFIMPNRVFEKGKAGRRFVIKMKDTSVYSFRQPEPEKISEALHKKEKEETIVSRENEEYNRIIDDKDGKRRNQAAKWYLKTRKRFNPVHASELFSEYEPMLEPKDPQLRQTRKISLSKTYDYNNKWRPATRGHEVFSATISSSLSSQQQYARSVR